MPKITLTVQELADTFANACADINVAYVRKDLRYDSVGMEPSDNPLHTYMHLVSEAVKPLLTQEVIDAYCAETTVVIDKHGLTMLDPDHFRDVVEDELMGVTIKAMVKVGVLDAAVLDDPEAYDLG